MFYSVRPLSAGESPWRLELVKQGRGRTIFRFEAAGVGQPLLDRTVFLQLPMIRLRCDDGHDEGIAHRRLPHFFDRYPTAGAVEYLKILDDLMHVRQLAGGTHLEAQEILRLRKRLYEILADATGKDEATIEHDCDRNKWLDAEEAVDYGCVDKILDRMPEPEKEEK